MSPDLSVCQVFPLLPAISFKIIFDLETISSFFQRAFFLTYETISTGESTTKQSENIQLDITVSYTGKILNWTSLYLIQEFFYTLAITTYSTRKNFKMTAKRTCGDATAIIHRKKH